jgi:NADPH2:quinone reductase
MRAALIERYGEPPVVRQVDDPRPKDAQALVEVEAAPLNPVDLSIASGKFYQGSPPTPYVPGGEGVGRLPDGGQRGSGQRVYFRSILPNGSFAERALANAAQTIPIPDEVPDGLAAALGTPGIAAFMALTRRGHLQPGETVLVLGASGVLGTIAVQLARLFEAGRVVAAARDQQALARLVQLGADETVDLKESDGLADRFRRAARDQVHLVIDPLWGAPASAAMEALVPHGRLVQVGQSAGPEIPVRSATVRGKAISILGYTSFLIPWDEQASAYQQMLGYAAARQLKVEHETLPLEAAPEAWKRQATSPHQKLILSPRR